jgi:hypothetical protein
MLCRSTISSVACEHTDRSLVNTRIPCYPPAVSPWYGSITIHSLSHRDMAPSPSAHCLAVTWLPHHLLTAIAMGQVPTGRLPMGKLLCYPLVACCITVLLLHLPIVTPREENSVGRDSLFCCWTLAYIALSHFSKDQHSSRQRYPSPYLEWPRKLWSSSTLECSISFSHGIVTVVVPLTGIEGGLLQRGFTGCILLGAAASCYNILTFLIMALFPVITLQMYGHRTGKVLLP